MSEDEESLALVRYGAGLSEKPAGKDWVADVAEEWARTDKAEAKQKPSFWQRAKQTFITETFQCLTASCVLVTIIGAIVVSFFYCKECLFAIMIFSACMCPFLPYYNIPLWTSILLITILGINYVHRDFTFIWK